MLCLLAERIAADNAVYQALCALAVEDALVEEVFTFASSSPDAGGIASELRAKNYLLRKLGLTRPEADLLLALARDRAIQAMPTGTEAHRTIQYHALSDLVRRCAIQHDFGVKSPRGASSPKPRA